MTRSEEFEADMLRADVERLHRVLMERGALTNEQQSFLRRALARLAEIEDGAST